jgi:amidase
MCTNVQDVADLLGVLVDPKKTKIPGGGYASSMHEAEGWKDLRVGTLDPEKWHYYDMDFQKLVPEATQQIVR